MFFPGLLVLSIHSRAGGHCCWALGNNLWFLKPISHKTQRKFNCCDGCQVELGLFMVQICMLYIWVYRPIERLQGQFCENEAIHPKVKTLNP